VKYEIDNTSRFLFAIFTSGKIAVISVETLELIKKIEVPGLETNKIFIDETCCFLGSLDTFSSQINVFAFQW
jgi:hypothetical protein